MKSITPLALITVACTMAACTGSTAQISTAPATNSDAPTTTSPTVNSDAPAVSSTVPADAIKRAICGTSTPCFIASTLPAGTDAAGRTLTVVEVVRADRPADLSQQSWRNASFSDECASYGYSLVVSQGSTVSQTRPLLDLCNDGYGARGMGEDTVTVKANSFSHTQVGGSAWMWSLSSTRTLSPDNLLVESADSFFTLGPNISEWTWNYETFVGTSKWSNNRCDEDAAKEDDLPEHTYTLIPAITLGADVSWSDTPLGRCAATVDSSGAGGFVTWGKPSNVADASFRTAIINGTTLVIDVRDDDWKTGAESWLYDDHVELWLSAQSGNSLHMDDCLKSSYPAAQWGIRVSDGEVFKGAGAGPSAPKVSRVALKDGAVRLTVQIPNAHEGITVVYSDSDDGKTQERLIATSPIVLKDATTIGGAHTLRGGDCVVQDGKIEPAMATAKVP